MWACKWQSTKSNNTIATANIWTISAILQDHKLHLRTIGSKHWQTHKNVSKTSQKLSLVITAMHIQVLTTLNRVMPFHYNKVTQLST